MFTNASSTFAFSFWKHFVCINTLQKCVELMNKGAYAFPFGVVVERQSSSSSSSSSFVVYAFCISSVHFLWISSPLHQSNTSVRNFLRASVCVEVASAFSEVSESIVRGMNASRAMWIRSNISFIIILMAVGRGRGGQLAFNRRRNSPRMAKSPFTVVPHMTMRIGFLGETRRQNKRCQFGSAHTHTHTHTHTETIE